MNKEDINKLVQLRQYLINEYGKLADPTGTATMMKEVDAGRVLVASIRSLDDLLTGHVQFESK
tara:strand:+ start:580 stop:768 length:189 start_codon:yes stop_codon:yes gene_type:complete